MHSLDIRCDLRICVFFYDVKIQTKELHEIDGFKGYLQIIVFMDLIFIAVLIFFLSVEELLSILCLNSYKLSIFGSPV